MRLLDRYIFRELVFPYLAGIIGFILLLSVEPLNRALSNIINDGVATMVAIRWFIYRVPQDLVLAFPMSTLLASLLLFSRLSRDSELTALKAGGISFWRLMYPMGLFALFSTSLTFLFNEVVIPVSAVKRREIRQLEMLGQISWQDKNNVVIRTSQNELVYARRVIPRDQRLENLVYFKFFRNSCIQRTSAQWAAWVDSENRWRLNGVCDTRFTEEGRFLEERVASHSYLTLAGDIQDFSRDLQNPGEQSIRELLRWIEHYERHPSINLLPLKVELFAKTSLPMSCLIFALIGASLGISKIRGGGFVGFGISIAIVFCYYVLLTMSLSMGKNGFLPPHLSAWLPNFVFLGLGFYLVDDANIQK